MKAILLVALAATAPAAGIRVSVLALFQSKRLLVSALEWQIGVERLAPQQPVELIAAGDEVLCRFGGRESRTRRILAGPRITISVPGKIERQYLGELEVTATAGTLTPVIRMDLETAVASVAAAEMPSGPAEAHKAQAIAARSYYAATSRRHGGFDFCDTTHCQLLKDPGPEDAATRGLVLAYQGRVFGAMYFRSCGGETRAAANASAYPYFRVRCEECLRSPHAWTFELPAGEEPPDSEAARLDLARRFGWNRVASNQFTIERRGGAVILHGKGHGHGIGMCQRGAIAMAEAGLDFRSILEHYYPRTSLIR